MMEACVERHFNTLIPYDPIGARIRFDYDG
ncbi:hypothetical protein NOCA2210049 [metagenome]|uniref:Uncharacterized protein n=1 Tax=metagenome TaxID=256318 RepID=A0A2P2BY73_9ZZZZ